MDADLTPAEMPPSGDHGGDGLTVARALGLDPVEMLDLSHSLNPFAPDVAYLMQQHSQAVRRYPDPAEATEALSAAIGIEPGRLLLTNGGSEAIALVARELGGQVRSEPEFGLHPRERLAPNGVLVRDCANFGLPGIARIAVPDPADLNRLESTLDWAGYAGGGTETKSG